MARNFTTQTAQRILDNSREWEKQNKADGPFKTERVASFGNQIKWFKTTETLYAHGGGGVCTILEYDSNVGDLVESEYQLDVFNFWAADVESGTRIMAVFVLGGWCVFATNCGPDEEEEE